MDLTRRKFLGMACATAAAPRLFAKSPADYDQNLTVLLSDLHVPGALGARSHQRKWLENLVAEILKLDPLPARAVVFGDIAYSSGKKEDYLAVQACLKPFEDAGIPVTYGLGNHDRRSNFLEVNPSYAKRTKVPGRITTVCDAGAVDLIMLDGLQGADNRPLETCGPVAGKLDRNQQDWLLAELKKLKKPTILCAHFPMGDLTLRGKPIAAAVAGTEMVAGFLHGHEHRWAKRYVNHGWSNGGLKNSQGLPSTGAWGDIGYALMRTGGGRAVVSLVQKDYFHPAPKKPGEAPDKTWKAAAEQNNGQICIFTLPEKK